MPADNFGILPYYRFRLVFDLLISVFIIGVLIWAVSSPYMQFTEYGPLILLGLIGFAVYELIKLIRWLGFSVRLSDEEIIIFNAILKKQIKYKWEEILSANARTSSGFSSFIELKSKDGNTINIPACIENNSFVLAKVESRFPSISKKS